MPMHLIETISVNLFYIQAQCASEKSKIFQNYILYVTFINAVKLCVVLKSIKLFHITDFILLFHITDFD